MWRNKHFRIALLFFVVLQIVLYLFMFFFHSAVPFDKQSYLNESHHYVHDARVNDGEFSLIRGLGVWDAQWYLRIADDGYPPKKVFDSYDDPRFMGALTYAFFPFYPIILAAVNFIISDIEITAFLVANVLLLANFVSLYYVVSKLFSKAIALKTIFLLFLFPFSIFYRSYFTESIFLLLLLWFSYFLIKQKWFYSTVMAALLFITRPNGMFMGILLFWAFVRAVKQKKFQWYKAGFYLALSLIPFAVWCYVCYLLTDNPFYWHKVQAVWFESPSMIHTFGMNIERIASFFEYPIHGTRESKIDVLMVLLTGGLLIWSKKFFKKYPQLWWISFFIWLAPLILKDLMSYSRYQIISFPLFIFLASQLSGWKLYVVCAVFFALLLFSSLYLVNWQWVG